MAQNKSRQCLLVLTELAKHWPVRIWIARAFVNLLNRLTGQNSVRGSTIDAPCVDGSGDTNTVNLDISAHDVGFEGTPLEPGTIRLDQSHLRDLYAPEYSMEENPCYDVFSVNQFDPGFDTDQFFRSIMDAPLAAPFEDIS